MGGEGDNRGKIVGWHHGLNGHEFEQTPGVIEGQGSLACCSLWGCKNSDMTELLYCTELNYVQISVGENIFVTFDRIFQLKYPFAQFASFRGILLSHGFHAGSDYKEHTCNVGDLVSVPGLGRSLDKEWIYAPVFWPGEFHGLCSPWCCKE